ncbi:MAG TPA: dephospho-CoA kinase [Solirubrobacteraceae bacterium]|nr:dephospho-CoA kinase [Solirubrobacteraceae bacterium]
MPSTNLRTPSPKPDPEAAASGTGRRAGRVPFIGLTGGIGAGKSTALDALERAGAAVLSTDRVVHQLYGDDDVLTAVRGRFGDAIERDGMVDRAAIARRAFASDEDRAWLEGLLWPLVGARMASWRESLELSQDPPRAAIVEVPLLFESGMEGAFDATIAVVASEELRASRAGSRGHEALAERSARQLTQKEKAQRATYVVLNDGTVEELGSKLSALLEKLGS